MERISSYVRTDGDGRPPWPSRAEGAALSLTFRERVQQAVGAAYRLERELGGGGMSCVFVAEEVGLGRRVVLKVLPPELAAEVNRDRFRREIALAAGLQHPHVVPLLTAGEGDGLLWYVMPFIEGESLRSRLARDGRVEPREAVRLLRDVADALGYAHAQGIVHRDIKPDNILITAGHAVVTDFGVAKALSRGTDTAADGVGGASLTQLGLALGTPAYMAPEQAAADPDVDHRADLYALGCVAYEMLAGRTPFAGLPPAQQLAAHVSTPAPRLGATDQSPALGALVEALLAKAPSARPADAAAVITALDGLAAGSGEASGVRGARSLEASLRRMGAPAALLAYGVVAPMAALVGRRAALALGLPAWVEWGGVGLLAFGAILLVAAAAGWVPQLTQRGAVVGGVASLALLLAAAGGDVALRRAGIGPRGSLAGRGEISRRDRVLIAEFDNRTADSLLGSVVTEAFRTDFLRTGAVTVVQQRAVAEALVRMQRDPAARLDAGLARELAQREGVKAVVEGEVAQVGGQYVLTARLVRAEDGEILAAFRQSAAPDRVVDAVDRLSRDLRERVGESLATLRSQPELARVTTASLPALRKYSEALRLGELGTTRGDRQALLDEVRLLEETVALDSAFAMAWRRLGVRLGNLGVDPRRATEALTRAYQLRDRLTPREAALAEAMYYNRVTGDQDGMIRAYRTVLAIDSTDFIALNNLGVAYMQRREYPALLDVSDRWLAIDSMAVNAWAWRAQALAALGRDDEARRTADFMARRLPDSPQAAATVVMLAWQQRRWDEARQLVGRALERAGAGPVRAQLLSLEAGMDLVQGRAAAATRTLRAVRAEVPLADAVEAKLVRLNDGLYEANIEIFVRQRPERARALLDEAVAAVGGLETIPPERRPLADLAFGYSLAGAPARAEQFLTERARVAASLPAGARGAYLGGPGSEADSTDLLGLGTRGLIHLTAGRLDSAAALIERVMASPRAPTEGHGVLGLALARAGRDAEAIAAFERYLGVSDPERRFGADLFYRVPVLEALAAAYERQGSVARAREAYRELIDLWRGADPDLQPRVQAAKAALARLVAEPAGRG